VASDVFLRTRHLANQLRQQQRFAESQQVHMALTKRWPGDLEVVGSHAALLLDVAKAAEAKEAGSGLQGYVLNAHQCLAQCEIT
jgi:hypothetical protein